MSHSALAFDTSNYTTSVARYAPGESHEVHQLLSVEAGALGLRQQEALFQHIKAVPRLLEQLLEADPAVEIVAVGASTAPREAEGSYMPCFLAGKGHGEAAARLLKVPFYPWSHQQGHLAAAAWSAGRLELLDRPFLAWHLSGGTTELLEVLPAGSGVTAQAVGGTSDISAGQLIDRAGLLLGLRFPAGQALDALAAEAEACAPFPVKQQGLRFSLSGIENQVKARVERGAAPQETARFVLETVAFAVRQITLSALETRAGWPVLFSGGVASNQLLCQRVPEGIFCAPRYATDNAMGVAILTHRRWEAEHG